MTLGVQQAERRPQLTCQAKLSVSHHWKAAAPLGAISRECPNADEALRIERPTKPLDVRGAIGRRCQEVECRAIMPNIVTPRRLWSRPRRSTWLAPPQRQAAP